MGAENVPTESNVSHMASHSPAAGQESQAKVALVTGASSGIGEAVARKLVASGMIVIGCARRETRLQAIAESLLLERNATSGGSFYPYKCDLLDEAQVHGMFKWIEQTFGTLNLLVNNAGTARFCSMLDAPTDALDVNFDLNCKATARCAHYALKIMLKQEKFEQSELGNGKSAANSGQIVFVNSIAAYIESSRDKPFLNGYCAAKHALRIMVSALRGEFRAIKSGIRIGEISPGFVDTEIFDKAFPPAMREENACVRKMIDAVLKQMQPLQPSDVAELVLTMVQAPSHVEINEIIVRPTHQPE